MATLQPGYALTDDGRFVVEHYHHAKPFSNFLPGIAGRWGVPAWVFYVNRGQAVCSMGVRDKDGAILEFSSFNQACLEVARQGFRTFISLDGDRPWEPFVKTDDPRVRQTLTVSAGEVEIVEENRAAGLEVRVVYFPLVNLPLAGLGRLVTVRNLDPEKSRRLAWIDGAARVLPHGMTYRQAKDIARHLEAMMGVAERDGIPLFRLKQSAADTARVEATRGGSFYLPLRDGVRIVVDPEAVFGAPMELDRPWVLDRHGLAGVLAHPEVRANKTPCAFSCLDETLPAGGAVSLVSILGFVPEDDALDRLRREAAAPDFVARQRAANRDLLGEIAGRAFTVTASPAFDAYCGQNFLDNCIRGGMPLALESAGGPTAIYVYARQNGDLERDYHWFVLEPTYLSQGTGHYRSVLQNRRMDTWFFPEVGDANLVTFMNLMQTDGYNPLEVTVSRYRVVEGKRFERWLARTVKDRKARAALADAAREPFTPGAFLMRLERAAPGLDRDAALRDLVRCCRECEVGALHEGFWVDHWTYNLDLLDSYLAVFPERLRALLLERRDYTFFDDPDRVVPRSEKCVRVDGKVRRYGSVVRDEEKLARIRARSEDAWRVRARHGRGAVYRTCLLVKLLGVAVNRLATLDPDGIGIDMEADKPGWNDSLNGLPGRFGSALNETLELLRLCRFLRDAAADLPGPARESVAVHEELAAFMRSLDAALNERMASRGGSRAARYWERSNALKEAYREATRHGVSGRESRVTRREIGAFAARAAEYLEGLFTGPRDAVMSPDGVPYTYYVHEVERYRRLRGAHVLPLAFRKRPTRRFLEGPVHWMRVLPEQAREVYQAVRRSPLFDRELGMYRSCEDMTGEDPELGRAVGAYPRGWIENESIYLHMEYKYLLEILRSGLCEEFYQDARTALIPFMDPSRYGRSILEGASFIVSGAYADPTLHGQAFQPRLSGVTSEMVHIWTLMMAGPRPFRVAADGTLELALEPRLAGWLFTERPTNRRWLDVRDGWGELEVPAAAVAFRFLGSTLVVYHNPERRDTWHLRPVRWRIHTHDGKSRVAEGPVLRGETAAAVRAGDVRRLDVELAPGQEGGFRRPPDGHGGAAGTIFTAGGDETKVVGWIPIEGSRSSYPS